MKLNSLKHFAVHKYCPCAKTSEYHTKTELFCLLENEAWCSILANNLKRIEAVDLTTVSKYKNSQNLLHLIRQLKKASCSNYHERYSRLVHYNQSIYLVRIYKFANAKYFKIEVSKVNHGTRQKGVKAPQKIRGMCKLMKRVLKDLELFVFPPNYHKADYYLLNHFCGCSYCSCTCY